MFYLKTGFTVEFCSSFLKKTQFIFFSAIHFFDNENELNVVY